MNFPLYESLMKLCIENDKKEFDLNAICNKIEKCKDDIHENIAALILHHHYLENKNKRNVVPYNGKYISENKTSVVHTLQNLPKVLQMCICYYVCSLQ
jgi:hypothetical protein